jgi:hypothetical protein
LTHGPLTLVPLGKSGVIMPDYEEILTFLAANPPTLAAERELHASLLELIAKCLRSDAAEEDETSFDEAQTRCIRWMDIN